MPVADGKIVTTGRFAPTPSGPLHFGSLVAALASYLDSRTRGGRWLLRIDDLDRDREAKGAGEIIVSDLAALGFEWDGPVYTQHERSTRYRQAVDELLAAGLAFPCACTRREIQEQNEPGEPTAIYPGTCRNGLPPGREGRSVRLRIPDETLCFEDEWAGTIRQSLARDVGDFVVWRVEGMASYHLATVLDDADAGVTRVVRGADLLDSTPRQILLQQLLGLPTPAYAHFPLVRAADGRKLGKQTHASRIDTRHPARTLVAGLGFLNQAPPEALESATLNEVWGWAMTHWRASAVGGG